MENRKLYLCRKCMINSKDKIHDFVDYHCSGSIYTSPKNNKDYYYGINFYYDDYDGKCPCCGEPLEEMKIGLDELYNITESGSPNPDYVLAMNDLKAKDIIEYTERYNKLVNQQHELKEQKRAAEAAKREAEEREQNTRRCPKCGSTNFTPVRKKYGLFLGFATNKVELVCNNCGYRMKAEN
ncbi:MAG TPA: hypothetical protein DCW90_09955 [Lachnospiraceae bacterium]|nr:hypothetical protein [Lachnospiraceae bacterium]